MHLGSINRCRESPNRDLLTRAGRRDTPLAMSEKTQLDHVYEWEKTKGDAVWLVQPMGGGVTLELTWKQALDEARRMATHLKSLGLPERSQIALFSKNTAWWLITDLAIWMAGHVSVPLYPILTPQTIRQVLEHSEARLIFIGKLDGFAEMEPGIPSALPRIAMPLSPKMDAPQWKDIIAKTEPTVGSPRPAPNELATILYTSGTTGVPKGVMHSFATMCASMRILDIIELPGDSRLLSYLPLAHAFERTVVETTTFVTGAKVFFAESLDTFVHDIRRARPTFFASVPRLWLKFHLGVLEKMPAKKLSFLLKIPIVRGIVARKVLEGLGLDQVKHAVTGSAPIPPELLAWYRSLGLELLEGYGMTENFSYSHVNRVSQVKVGTVGVSNPDVETKISEQGEVLVKSPCTMLGYFKAPELTAEVMTDDGFLKTGDRGVLDEQGFLKITGRVKELFKTSKGKYVAPAPIENKLLTHHALELACVQGNGLPQPYAVVVLSEQTRKALANGTARDEVARALAEHLQRINAELDQHEQLELIAVAKEPWTIENGTLTPTMKVKRAVVEDQYAKVAEGWYDKREPIVWA
jgi:long-subunit acyl-CoA synthetase (AMP-forming)